MVGVSVAVLVIAATVVGITTSRGNDWLFSILLVAKNSLQFFFTWCLCYSLLPFFWVDWREPFHHLSTCWAFAWFAWNEPFFVHSICVDKEIIQTSVEVAGRKEVDKDKESLQRLFVQYVRMLAQLCTQKKYFRASSR